MLLAASHLVFYVFTTRVEWPVFAELASQGLIGEAAKARGTGFWAYFWVYPRLLFRPDPLGDWLFSVYPHVLVVLAVLGLVLRMRTAPEPFWWLLFVFAGMQFNFQRAEGAWISGFRNIRHMHVLVYPLMLLLTGYLLALRARFPRTAYGFLAGLVAFSAWQCVSTATKTVVSFGDIREVCEFLATLPPKRVYGDFQIATGCQARDMQRTEWSFVTVEPNDKEKRQTQLAAVRSGYLVTGGSREPYYGCNVGCIPSPADIDPEQWKLLKEFPDPVGGPTTWRPDPFVRIWEATGG